MFKLKNKMTRTLISIFPLAFSGAVIANTDAENVDALPSKPATMEEYGVPKYLPKLGISAMVQELHFVEHARKKVTIGDNVHESEVYLVQTTDKKGNIDLRIKYDPNNVNENENLLENIESITKAEYQMRQYAEMYDKESVKVKDLGNGDLEITFDYSKYTLPQDLAYFRFMQGKLLLTDGQPVSLIVTNRQPFTQGKYLIDSYQQTTFFDTLLNGRTVIKDKKITAIGKHKKKAAKIEIDLTPVVYYDDNLGAVVKDEALLTKVSDPRMREEYVELDRTFPLMADMVRRQGIDVPLPFGISIAYRNQDMDFNFTDFNIMGMGLNEFFDPEQTIAHVTAESLTIRGDVNILPFWNVFGYVGQIDVNAVIDATFKGLDTPWPLPDLPSVQFDVPLHLRYDLIGAGTTLSMGYKEFFASVTGTYSLTRLKGNNNADWGDGIVTVQPMLGYQLLDYRAQIFIGAEYQALKPRMSGNLGMVDIPVIGEKEFDYDVGVNLNQWAYLVGFNKQIGKHYNLTMLYNRGETRNALTVNLGYRF
ncbi:hypothetical protein AB4560_22465 [Vibrio sp. 10N.222.51.C12]|uniref:hypothetical protein n=1 Tax=unclassified Vibrio TaxID=2614977 RepID=UPI001F52F07C|nr:hypothetical protein [Vibrio sp. 10N.286.48.B7]